MKIGITMKCAPALRHWSEVVEKYLDKLTDEFQISVSSIMDPKPFGRAVSIQLEIEKAIIRCDGPCLMSNPDDLAPVNTSQLMDYVSNDERDNRSVAMIITRKATNPFGMMLRGRRERLSNWQNPRKKTIACVHKHHFANTDMILFLPETIKEFKNVPLDGLTHPEKEIVPMPIEQNSVAALAVEKWIPFDHAENYKHVSGMDSQTLQRFLDV